MYRVQFDDPEGWEDALPGVRYKRVKNGAAELRLVEMLPSASHPDWCTTGHVGCVVEGILEVEFASRRVQFAAGDGILIPPGKAHQHRPRAVADRVRLALVDYADV